jgi:hypothetical protein
MNAMRRPVALAVVLLLLSLAAVMPRAWAWNDPGHMVAALLMYDGLHAEEQAALTRLLRAHPRFEGDFQALMPDAVREAGPAEQDRWLFAFAATWPDVARQFRHVSSPVEREQLVRRWHNGRWHYINLPVFLDDEERRRIGEVDANMARDWQEVDALHLMNAVQALGKQSVILADGQRDDADRALALSWLLHVVGDLHQPLHTTALFTSRAFPSGDRGGNDLRIDARNNLHFIWDSALGPDRRWTTVLRHFERLRDDVESHVSVAKDPAASWADVFMAWAEEGHDVARHEVYKPEILAQVAQQNTRRRRGIVIELPDSYDDNLRTVAEQRLQLAGVRGAWLFRQLLAEAAAGAEGTTADDG